MTMSRPRRVTNRFDFFLLKGHAMTDQAELLSILDAHGKNFLQSFDISSTGSSGKRKATGKARSSSSKRIKLSEDQSDSEEEWGGIKSTDSELMANDESLGSCSGTGDLGTF